MRLRSEYYINLEHYLKLSGESIDWFIKSLKYKYNSDEWQICRLKSNILSKESVKRLNIAVEEMEKSI